MTPTISINPSKAPTTADPMVSDFRSALVASSAEVAGVGVGEGSAEDVELGMIDEEVVVGVGTAVDSVASTHIGI